MAFANSFPPHILSSALQLNNYEFFFLKHCIDYSGERIITNINNFHVIGKVYSHILLSHVTSGLQKNSKRLKHLEFNIHSRSNIHLLNGTQKRPFFRD